MKVKLTLSGVKELSEALNNRLVNNFITNVFVVNSSDILLMFSFVKEKLLISLNHSAPFISLVKDINNYSTTLGNLNENLRKYLKGAYINKVEQLNNDRVMKFTLYKSNEFFEKETFYLILEFVPTINNLILLDKDNKIVFAKHYTDLTAARPIIRGMEYISLKNNSEMTNSGFDLKEYEAGVRDYLDELDMKVKKEKSLPLYNFFKNKIKSLNKKIKILNVEKDEAVKRLSYKEIGENLLMYAYSEEGRDEYISSLDNYYDSSLSVLENSNRYFDKYKKSKRTIENDDREINIATDTIKEYEHILSLFEYFTDDEIEELYRKYLPKKIHSKHRKEIDSKLPYYIEYRGVRIGFGKSKEQNNYLTFKKANKDDIYLHIKDSHGAHVVIFSNDPSKEVILLASEIALLLSNKESGEIYIADIKDVKKGASIGEALINKFETITLHSVRKETKNLIKEQKRFN